jgi:hypothetical protein
MGYNGNILECSGDMPGFFWWGNHHHRLGDFDY